MVQESQALGWTCAHDATDPLGHSSDDAWGSGVRTEADHVQKGFDLIQRRDKLCGHQRPPEVPSLWVPVDVTK